MDTKTFCEELLNYYTGASFTLTYFVALLLCVAAVVECCFFGGYLIRRYRRAEIDGDSAVICGIILVVILTVAGPLAVSAMDKLGRSGQAAASLMSEEELRICFPPAESLSTIKLDANVTAP